MKQIITMNLQAALFALFLTSLLFAFAYSTTSNERAFLSCLVKLDSTMSSIIYTPDNTTFLTTLNFLIQNARFINPETPKPGAILAPVRKSQIQTAIFCGKRHHLEMRIRSGGHDFEGSSYISQVPFFVLDMFNFNSLSVDSEAKTAWVGVGLTLGQTYYGIYATNSSLAYPAGFWPTVGVGGHISGGGYGPLVRQFGLAADNIVDARVIDANGRILDRKSMGEDLFWAIRGGIGANFAVILSYKLSLVEVPESVVAFYLNRTLEQNAVQLVYKWQQIARIMPLELTLTVQIRSLVVSGKRTVQAEFISAYRGSGVHELLSLMRRYFPELGLTEEDCREMLWIESYPFLLGQAIANADVKDFMTNRNSVGPAPAFKWKVDFAQDPIPPEGLVKIFNELFQVPPLTAQLGWTVFGGGIMDRISESQIPFPHRGKLMIMRQIVFWNATDDSPAVVRSRVDWVRRLHNIIGLYVPTNPRAQYADYRDLDLGTNNVFGRTSIEQARIWGYPYFKDNFNRLVKVKSFVDPQNFFKNEQSIPMLQYF